MFVAPRHVSPYRDSADDMHCKITIYFLHSNSFRGIKKRTLGEQLLIKGAS